MNDASTFLLNVPALASRPKLALGLVRLLMIITLVTVLSASLYLQSAFDSLRASNFSAVNVLFDARSVQLSLHQALAEERLARLARSGPALREAAQGFDAARRQALGRLSGLDDRKAGPGVPLHRSAALLRRAVPLAIDALRRLIPGGSGAPVGESDVTILAVSDQLVEQVIDDALALRSSSIHRIKHRERLDIAAPLAALTLFVVLLGGSATRLIEGRQRLHAARRAATHQAQLLIGAVDHMRDGVAVFDAEDRLVLSNGRLGSVAGLPDELMAVRTPYDAIKAALAGADPPLLDEPRLAPGQPVAGEMRIDGRVLAIFRSAMPDGGQMLTVSDVTERVVAEELIQRAQRMEVLGRLTGGVAHDFNNVLQALTANLEILSAEIAGRRTTRLDELAAEALNAVERGTRLTRHLLAFARRQELAAAALETSTILHGLRDLLARTLGDAIEVRLSVQPELWPVLADATGLENALLNLALNGRDAMPTGGTLSIDARNHTSADGGQWVCIEIADEGAGMTDEQLARAVEPFYTTKTVGAGVGLGLSLVDGFARQSGGHFRLRSELGRGTNAILQLPRAAELPAPAPARPSIEHGHGETVLLVEDDPVVSRASREALEQLGYEVVEAADAQSACARIAAGLRPDLMFTDVMMPGPLDVADLARRARETMPALPILFNTGDTEARVLAGIAFDDRMRLVPKPWRLADISRQIRHLLDQVPVLT